MAHQDPRDNPANTTADADLLSALLAAEVPSRQGQLQPVRVRSTAQQQQIALRGFLRRNWVDRVLYGAERLLVLAAVIAFGYWLLDGPVRDWLHYSRDARVVWAAQERPTPTLAHSLGAANTPYQQAAGAVPLPFTRPDDSSAPAPAPARRDEFLVPQSVPGAPVLADPRPTRLTLPSIGAAIDVREIYVIDGEWEVAEYAAGYHHGSALPGNLGNSVFSGHAGLRGAVFKDLGRLSPGDEVIVETAGWRYVYQVRAARNVWPTQVEVMDPTPTATLTLITCTNWDTQRLVVVADLVDARPLS